MVLTLSAYETFVRPFYNAGPYVVAPVQSIRLPWIRDRPLFFLRADSWHGQCSRAIFFSYPQVVCVFLRE